MVIPPDKRHIARLSGKTIIPPKKLRLKKTENLIHKKWKQKEVT